MLELSKEKFDQNKLPYKIQDILLILELLKAGECKFTYPKVTDEEFKEIKDKWIPWKFYFSFSKKTFFFNQEIWYNIVELENPEEFILGDTILLGGVNREQVPYIVLNLDYEKLPPHYYVLKAYKDTKQLKLLKEETEKNIENYLLDIVKRAVVERKEKETVTIRKIIYSTYSFQHLKERDYQTFFFHLMKNVLKKGETVNRIAVRETYTYLPEIFTVGWLSLPETVKEEKFNWIVNHYKKMIQNTPKIKVTFQKQFPKIQGLFGKSCQKEFDDFLNQLKEELEIE